MTFRAATRSVRQSAHRSGGVPLAMLATVGGLLILLVAALGSAGSSERSLGERSGVVASDRAAHTGDKIRTAAEPDTLAAIAADVNEGDYEWATSAALWLPRDERVRIHRKISRHIAMRVRSAVAHGRTQTAAGLLTLAKRYPATPEIRRARALMPAR